jgi:hypothetical protein
VTKGDGVHIVAGPFYAFAALAVVAGGMKAARPGPAVLALRSVGAKVPAFAVRLGGATEAGIGSAAVLAGGRLPAVLVAISYAVFAVFVVAALRTGGVVSSCGCFGKADTPPTLLHIAVNVVAALVAAAFAFGSAPPLREVVAAQPLGGVPFLALTGMCGWLTYLTLAVRPALRSGRASASTA